MITITDDTDQFVITSPGAATKTLTKAFIKSITSQEAIPAKVVAGGGPLTAAVPAMVYIESSAPDGLHNIPLANVANIGGTTVFANAEAAAAVLRGLL